MRPRLSGLLVPVLAAMALVGGPLPGHSQTAPVVAAPGLNLSPSEKARAQAQQQQFVRDMTALQANKSMTMAQKTAKAQSLYKAHDAEMLAILTPAQRTQVLAQRGMAMQQRQSFMKAHKSEISAGSALAEKLNKSLSPSQKTQIDGIRKQLADQGRSLSSDKTLSPQVKMQRWMSVQQGAQTKILALLTPIQKADYLQMQQMQKHLMTEARPHP